MTLQLNLWSAYLQGVLSRGREATPVGVASDPPAEARGRGVACDPVRQGGSGGADLQAPPRKFCQLVLF